MATTDVRFFDGTNWVSVKGEQGDSVTSAQADANNVPLQPNNVLGEATASVTPTTDADGNIDLDFTFGIPVGKNGIDGTPGESATVSVQSTDTETLDYGQPAVVNVSDGALSDPNDLKLNFDFKIPEGKPGQGINIIGSVDDEASLPACDTPGLVKGDMYIVALNENGEVGHGFIYNGNDSDCWSDVGQVAGEDGKDGCDPNLTAGDVTTNTLAAGNDATVAVQRQAGSTNCAPKFDFAFGIPGGQDSTIEIQEAVTFKELCGTESAVARLPLQSGGQHDPVYKLELDIPVVKVTSSDTEPQRKCTGDIWIVTG